MIALLIDIYVLIAWLVFFKFKLLKFDLKAKIATAVLGVLICFGVLIAVNFLHPQSLDARVLQQVVPVAARIPHPGRIVDVVVKPNVPVKRGEVLFQVDPEPYRIDIARLEAALAAAEQNVPQLGEVYNASVAAVERLKEQSEFAKTEADRYERLFKQDASTAEQHEQATRNLRISLASLREAEAQSTKAKLAMDAKTSDGVNVDVAQLRAQLAQAKYDLAETTVRAPIDGFVTNLQLDPGFVVQPGVPVLTFVSKPDGIVGVTLPQEYLGTIEPGNEVEVALDMYPGKMIRGKVDSVIWATGQGQLAPSGTLPTIEQASPAGRFAVKVVIDEEEQKRYRLPAGAAGAAAIYTNHGKPWKIVRRVVVRWYTWLNYIKLAM